MQTTVMVSHQDFLVLISGLPCDANHDMMSIKTSVRSTNLQKPTAYSNYIEKIFLLFYDWQLQLNCLIINEIIIKSKSKVLINIKSATIGFYSIY